MKNRLISNFLSLSTLQLFTYVLPIVTLPYLVKVLGVDKYGLVMFAQSLMVFFILFVDYGFDLSATKNISIYRENSQKVTEIFSSVIIIKVILLIISLLLMTILLFSVDKFNKEIWIYYFSFLWVIGQSLFPIWYFQGIERMKYITIVNVISKIIFTITIFIFIKEENDYLLYPIFNGVGALLGTLLAFFLLKRDFNQSLSMQTYATLWTTFKDSTPFFLSRVSVSLFTSINVFILGLVSNNIIVGYYSIAEKLYQAIQRLYSPVVQVLYPYIAKEKNLILLRKVLFILIPLNIIGVIILFIWNKWLFSLLFSEQVTQDSITVFNILLIAILVTLPSSLIGYPVLGALGFSNYVNKSIIYASILHILGLGCLFILKEITPFNVAFMVVITESFIFLSRVFYIRRTKVWLGKL